jgi:hypothetical protein
VGIEYPIFTVAPRRSLARDDRLSGWRTVRTQASVEGEIGRTLLNAAQLHRHLPFIEPGKQHWRVVDLKTVTIQTKFLRRIGKLPLWLVLFVRCAKPALLGGRFLREERTEASQSGNWRYRTPNVV